MDDDRFPYGEYVEIDVVNDGIEGTFNPVARLDATQSTGTPRKADYMSTAIAFIEEGMVDPDRDKDAAIREAIETLEKALEVGSDE